MIIKQFLQAAVLLSALTFSACSSPFVVQQGAELATVAVLTKQKASVDDANNVSTTALTVKNLVNSEIDPTSLKLQVLQLVQDNFKGENQAVMWSLTNTIATLVLQEVNKDGVITDGEITVLVSAATDGVISGANLYIVSLESK